MAYFLVKFSSVEKTSYKVFVEAENEELAIKEASNCDAKKIRDFDCEPEELKDFKAEKITKEEMPTLEEAGDKAKNITNDELKIFTIVFTSENVDVYEVKAYDEDEAMETVESGDLEPLYSDGSDTGFTVESITDLDGNIIYTNDE